MVTRLHPEDLAEIKAEIARALGAERPVMLPPVLTTAQALTLVGKGSVRALRRWAADWAPRASVAERRWSLVALRRGLDKEALAQRPLRQRRVAA